MASFDNSTQIDSGQILPGFKLFITDFDIFDFPITFTDKYNPISKFFQYFITKI